jgi:uncharacterized protein
VTPRGKAGCCPQCGTPVEPGPGNAWRPFCSERCKLADLGHWFAGRYAIPADDDSELPADADQDPQPRQ